MCSCYTLPQKMFLLSNSPRRDGQAGFSHSLSEKHSFSRGVEVFSPARSLPVGHPQQSLQLEGTCSTKLEKFSAVANGSSGTGPIQSLDVQVTPIEGDAASGTSGSAIGATLNTDTKKETINQVGLLCEDGDSGGGKEELKLNDADGCLHLQDPSLLSQVSEGDAARLLGLAENGKEMLSVMPKTGLPSMSAVPTVESVSSNVVDYSTGGNDFLGTPSTSDAAATLYLANQYALNALSMEHQSQERIAAALDKLKKGRDLCREKAQREARDRKEQRRIAAESAKLQLAGLGKQDEVSCITFECCCAYNLSMICNSIYIL
jgi:hypothetical protein